MTTDPFAGVPKRLNEGRFELIDVLGSGGAAEVWRARDRERNIDVAIKVLDPVQGRANDQATRFVAEAKAMHSLRHPRIVRVVDIGKEDGWYWFAMDLCPGGTLRDRLLDGKMPAPQALRFVFQVLEALDAAHRAGVVHRDVKPANVLIDAKGDAVLADFGVAKNRPDQVPHRTEAGAFFGSAGYAAPEQRRDAREATPASDVYAAGAVLYALMTGRNPADLTMMTIDDWVLADLPAPVRGVLEQACVPEPERRLPDARAMAIAIAAARDALGDPSPPGRAWMAELDRMAIAKSQAPGCLRFWARR